MTAQALLLESADKRYSAFTVLREAGEGYTVGWYSPGGGYECEQHFADLADAGADYILFSLGKSRWRVSPAP